jgi:hypothetical protein
MYVFAVIEYASRRIRVLGATRAPDRLVGDPGAKNLVMDLEDTGCRARFLIRDRDGKFPELFDTVLADSGIDVVLSGIRMPGMNSITERWVQTCRRELLDRSLIWKPAPPAPRPARVRTVLHGHRPHQGIANARPLYPLPAQVADPDKLARLDIRRRDRLGGILHEYEHAA